MRQVSIVGLLVLFIIVSSLLFSYFLLGKTNVLPVQQQKITVSVSPTPISEALPPLYSGVVWGKPNTGFTTMLTGHVSTPDASAITTLGQRADTFYYIISQPFETSKRQSLFDYYEQWFAQHGWKEDIMADGPTGSEIGFLKKGNRFLVTLLYPPHNTSLFTATIEHN